MRLSGTALALLVWLGASSIDSLYAFSSTPSFRHTSNNKVSNNLPYITDRSTKLRMVASTVPPKQSVADMQRGIGGRLEDAFEAAKERGEAAFVTFVTAGYPRAQGRMTKMSVIECASHFLTCSDLACTLYLLFRYSRHSHGDARGRCVSD